MQLLNLGWCVDTVYFLMVTFFPDSYKRFTVTVCVWPGSGIWKSCFLLFNLISPITCQPSGMSRWTSEALCLSKRWTISWLCLVARHATDKATEILTVCLTKSLHFYHLALIFFYKNTWHFGLGKVKNKYWEAEEE